MNVGYTVATPDRQYFNIDQNSLRLTQHRISNLFDTNRSDDERLSFELYSKEIVESTRKGIVCKNVFFVNLDDFTVRRSMPLSTTETGVVVFIAFIKRKVN